MFKALMLFSSKDYGLTVDSFHELLGSYQEDMEVMQGAQTMMHPAGRGDG